jgi:hypothetical protein
MTPSAFERQQERKQEKLAEMKQQVEDGTLRVRKMTPEERAENPPRPAKPRKKWPAR